MEAELGLKPAGTGAVVFKPLSAGEFVRAENEMQELLDVAARESASRIERRGDDYGYEWLIVSDDEFEDLVTTVHLVGSELAERGFGPQLLAAVFRFDGGRNPVYFVYGYKRGAFWPFVPTGERERDNAEELELKAKLEEELPIEPDIAMWFALFGLPL
jgi:PspA associated protein B